MFVDINLGVRINQFTTCQILKVCETVINKIIIHYQPHTGNLEQVQNLSCAKP